MYYFFVVLNMKQMLGKLGKTTFEPFKEEQEEGMTTNIVVEKQISAFKWIIHKKIQASSFSNHWTSSLRANSSFACKICNSMDHVVIIWLRIKNLKPKCGKCFLHWTKNYGIKCGCCIRTCQQSYPFSSLLLLPFFK